ncbi:MAG: PCRF domain-containing protein, partial [Pseudomonadota bacterium]|nr:PCRF domain-containing protein [Pseudomonadota bacterium]
MSIMDRLDGVISRHSELSALMASGDLDPSKYADLSREYAELSPIVEKAQEMKSTQSELSDLEELLSDSDTDAEMKELAEVEREELKGCLPDLEEALRILLLPKDAADEKSAILEIRAGTGGDEAALFAGDLMRMYQRYAEVHGWRAEFLDLSETELGGVKEAAISIAGRGVFAKLKFESGVHRVQRVPTTESGGRIHTSAATVAVLPEAEEVDIEVDPGDLRVDTYRASGAGGQHV